MEGRIGAVVVGGHLRLGKQGITVILEYVVAMVQSVLLLRVQFIATREAQ